MIISSDENRMFRYDSKPRKRLEGKGAGGRSTRLSVLMWGADPGNGDEGVAVTGGEGEEDGGLTG
jgi:hypothetical protein